MEIYATTLPFRETRVGALARIGVCGGPAIVTTQGRRIVGARFLRQPTLWGRHIID
jgi:hypothetical protein